MSQDDIANLQTVGKDAQAARRHFILKDDQHKVWEYIRTLRDGRVDFVLDNAGFEVGAPTCQMCPYTKLITTALHRLRLRGLLGHLHALCIEGRLPVSD